MLSKSQIKLIKSLAQKKYRLKHSLFTVEGVKGITEFLNSDFKLHHIYSVSDAFEVPVHLFTKISNPELKRISQLKTPNKALAIFEMPTVKPIDTNGLIVALDSISDPGNLGTIIRLCDWFGISDLLCSENTVDCYNPKVVQATMGSFTRVNINYLELDAFLNTYEFEKFGTFMSGKSIYNQSLPNKGIVVLGNEANGISASVENKIDIKLGIPRFGKLKATESLNVATATAIVLSEFKR